MPGHLRQTAVAVKQNLGGNGGRKVSESIWWALSPVVTVEGKLLYVVAALGTQESGGCGIPGDQGWSCCSGICPLNITSNSRFPCNSVVPVPGMIPVLWHGGVQSHVEREGSAKGTLGPSSLTLTLNSSLGRPVQWCWSTFWHPREETQSYVVPRREYLPIFIHSLFICTMIPLFREYFLAQELQELSSYFELLQLPPLLIWLVLYCRNMPISVF